MTDLTTEQRATLRRSIAEYVIDVDIPLPPPGSFGWGHVAPGLHNLGELLLAVDEDGQMNAVGLSALNDAYQALRRDHDALYQAYIATQDRADRAFTREAEAVASVRELRQLVLDHAGLILELTARLVLLETSDVWPGMPVECREHRCDYYNGYLAQGPAELEHEGYHAAERQYQHRTAQWENHMDTCQHCKTHFGDCPVAKRMQDGLHVWEKRLRA